MKKLLAFVLAALMVLTAVSALAEGEKNIPELTKEPMTILLWDIATEGFFTIDASGVVRGVHAGTTTAYAKVDGKVLECIVRIK